MNLKENEGYNLLIKAIMALESEEECERFLEDLMTRKEILDSAQRLLVAKLLSEQVVYSKIAEETGCHVYLREEEKTLPSFMTAGELYSTHGYSDAVTVAGLTFTVLHTPGHTPGSVCLICQDAIFAGDTLFAGSCGRTDFSGSDPAKMKESLQRLYALPGDYRVFPGHGEDTTLQYEREYNPYMRAMSLS